MIKYDSEQVPHKLKPGFKIAVIRILKCSKDIQRGTWTPVQGRLLGRPQLSQDLEDEKTVPQWKCYGPFLSEGTRHSSHSPVAWKQGLLFTLELEAKIYSP